ncbi:MAG: toll/interleukin-1 receptor domain-containing protein [Chloroflexota bacterium]|nr:toll/interleukin-1 receptor domain-containing protein [Chloroflexota bacterium]
MPILFVSHATEDNPFVDRLVEPMKAAGITLWIDHHKGIEIGDDWERQIQEGVNACDCGLFILSPRSVKSRWCAAERLRILDDGKPLYVALMETTARQDIPIILNTIQYADLRTDFDTRLDGLIAAILNPAVKADGAPTALRQRKLTGKMPPLLRTVALCGRQQDVQTVTGKLRAAPVQIIGVGGLGKSRLAAEVVATASPEAGAIWHFCTPISTVVSLQAEMQRHYRLDAKSDPQPLFDAVERQPPLVVIDNGEDVALAERNEYVEFIHTLHAAGAGVVLTSREVWDKLRPLFVHDPATLTTDTAQQAARELAKGLNVNLTDAEIAELSEAAHHHPGLIEWGMEQMSEAGGREPEMVIADIRALQSEDAQARLNEMILNDLKRADEAVPGASALLRTLVVFEGGFVLDTAAAVCGRDKLALEKPLAVLQKGRFVRRDAALRRYTIAPLVSSVLAADEAAQAAHFAYFAEQFSDDRANRDPERQRVIDVELTNLRAALRWGCGSAPVQAADLAWALKLYLLLRDAYALSREIMGEALSAAQAVGYGQGTGRMKLALGDLDMREARYGQARDNYDAALLAFRAIPDRLGEANTLQALGDLDRMEARYGQARDNYDAALTLAERIPSTVAQLNALRSLALLEKAQGNMPAARDYYRRCLALADSIEAFRNHPIVETWRQHLALWGE